MVGLEIVIRVTKRNRHEFLQAMEFMRHREASGTECCLYEEIGDSERLLWVERWDDHNALEANLHTEGFRTLLGAIKVLGELENLRLVQFKSLPDGEAGTVPDMC